MITLTSLPWVSLIIWVLLTVTGGASENCTLSPCKNGGTCKNTTHLCDCPNAYVGSQCQGRRSNTSSCSYHIFRANNDIAFSEANTSCTRSGRSLAMIKDSTIREFLVDNVKILYNASERFALWLGGFKENEVWYWMDKTAINTNGWDANYSVLTLNAKTNWRIEGLTFHSRSTSEKVEGYICEIPITSPCNLTSCLNGGQCINLGCQGNCVCAPGYFGASCENENCTLSPCKNGGTCKNTTHLCDCPNAYVGSRCQGRSSNTSSCSYQTFRVDNAIAFSEANTSCTIRGGSLAMVKNSSLREFFMDNVKILYRANEIFALWLGGFKENEIWYWMDKTAINTKGWDAKFSVLTLNAKRNWSNEGLTFQSRGIGAPNVQGYICEILITSPCEVTSCLNGGQCINLGCQGHCVCAPGYFGAFCENDHCSSSPCKNGGSCNYSTESPYFICVCRPEYEGLKCEREKRTHLGNCSYYIKYSTKKTLSFKEANHSCVLDGGSVAMIKTRSIQSIILKQIIEQYGIKGPSLEFWIGGQNVSRTWIWMDETKVPISGENSFWRYKSSTKADFMILTSYWRNKENQTRTTMHWASKIKAKKLPRYICERAVSENAFCNGRNMCLNGGSCKLIGCQETCSCTPRFSGDICQYAKLKLVKKNLLTKSASISIVTCTYQGYPAPVVKWRWGREGSKSEIRSDMPGSIFRIETMEEKISGLNQTTSILTIKLSEYASMVSCFATNGHETTTDFSFDLDDKTIFRLRKTSFYVYFGEDSRNFTMAELFCQSINGTLLTILDKETQDAVSKALIMRRVRENIFIGAMRQVEGNSPHWKWIISNGSKISSEIHSFNAWSGKEPDEPGKNCAMLDHRSGWKWTGVNCDTKLGFICQRRTIGIPDSFEVSVERCSANVTIAFNPSKESINVLHGIKIAETTSKNADDQNTSRIPIAQTTVMNHFSNLKTDTKYNITISVCPDCPLPYEETHSVATYSTLPPDHFPLRTVNLTVTENKCVLNWSIDSDYAIGFMIVGQSILAKSPSEKQYRQSIVYNTSKDERQHIINMAPNRIYTFTIKAEVCTGLGPPKESFGRCISNPAAPLELPRPNATPEPNSDGTISVQIRVPDETNGPISCIFVVVNYMPEDSENISTSYSLDNLTTAVYKAEAESLSSNDYYLALAISRSTISEDDYLVKLLGDESETSCDILLTENNRRRKRSVPSNKIIAHNRRLEDDVSYSFYTVTATPSDGDVLFKRSQTSNFVKPSSNSGTATAVVIVLLLIAIISVSLVILWKRRKLAEHNQQAMRLQEVEQNQESLYVNMTFNGRKPRSETDVPLEQLQSTYNELRLNEDEKFEEQFKKLKKEAKQLKCPTEVASSPTLTKKNRYMNILPYDSSRVTLQGKGDSSYINACYVNGFRSPKKFIATQGPLADTVDDFWRMVAEQNCTTIVMLTKCNESTRIKCEKYWPDTGKTQVTGVAEVVNTLEKECSCYKIRKFSLTVGELTSTVIQFHFLDWPDHGVPIATSNLVRFHEAVMKFKTNSPIVVHCSAGVGCTGTFIGYDILSDEAESLSMVDVYEGVLTLRKQRIDMVQTCDQYMLLHKLLLEKYLFGKTDISTEALPHALPSDDVMQRDFESLSAVGPIDQDQTGAEQRHHCMNRNKDIIPYNRSYVTIMMQDSETELPYINASVIQSYDSGISLIAAQGPVEQSVGYFWRAVLDNNVTTIVMLTKCVEGKQEQSACYWPNVEGTNLTLKDVVVHFQALSCSEYLTKREFLVARGGVDKTIIQYQYTGWSANENPKDTSDVLSLIEVMTADIESNGGRALIHCSDGAGRTGTFCAIVNLIARLKAEEKIDVFRTVKDLRDCRPGMVQTLDQYRFCFEAVSAYLISLQAYTNMEIKNQEQNENIYENL